MNNFDPAKINFEIDFWRQKIQFVELDFYNLIFQKSSTDQQGESIVSIFSNWAETNKVTFYKTFLSFATDVVFTEEQNMNGNMKIIVLKHFQLFNKFNEFTSMCRWFVYHQFFLFTFISF